MNSHWWDCSQLYGCDADDREEGADDDRRAS